MRWSVAPDRAASNMECSDGDAVWWTRSRVGIPAEHVRPRLGTLPTAAGARDAPGVGGWWCRLSQPGGRRAPRGAPVPAMSRHVDAAARQTEDPLPTRASFVQQVSAAVLVVGPFAALG